VTVPSMKRKTANIDIRVEPELVEKIDAWRAQQRVLPSRAAAIVYILEHFLKHDPPANPVPLSLSEPVAPERAQRARETPWRELTRRQCDVLALISEGKSNRLIADALTMTENTVKAHVKQIIRRLHVANRTQAALIVARARIRTKPAPSSTRPVTL